MNKLLKKELRLTAAPITYFFLAFALMTLIPGYPILVGGFFITLGIFYTFQMARESNDILYTALLPCKKQDVVRAKYTFCVLIELLGWLAVRGAHRGAADGPAGGRRLHQKCHDERELCLPGLAAHPLRPV